MPQSECAAIGAVVALRMKALEGPRVDLPHVDPVFAATHPPQWSGMALGIPAPSAFRPVLALLKEHGRLSWAALLAERTALTIEAAALAKDRSGRQALQQALAELASLCVGWSAAISAADELDRHVERIEALVVRIQDGTVSIDGLELALQVPRGQLATALVRLQDAGILVRIADGQWRVAARRAA